MRIGIMSMQRVCNYGSFLQAYGLKKIIESLHHEVVFVDYRPGKPVTYQNNRKAYYKSIVREFLMKIAAKKIDLLFFASEEQKYSLGFKKTYNSTFLPILGIGHNKKYNAIVDTLVIGSDEVFNCLQSNPEVGFSKELFGYNNNAKRVISYAASFGNTTLEALTDYKKKETVGELLMQFEAISVRDANSFNIANVLTGVKPEINLDPVLIYDFTNETIEPDVDEDYLVVYAYRNRLSNGEKERIKEFAKDTGKKIYAIGGYQDFCDKNIQGTPFEVLGYIKKSSCVITDTFHGTIFSIINRKPFLTFIRDGHGAKYGNYEKLMDLLERLHLSERAIRGPESLKDKMNKAIDYDRVNEILIAEKKHTIEYLKRNLTGGLND